MVTELARAQAERAIQYAQQNDSGNSSGSQLAVSAQPVDRAAWEEVKAEAAAAGNPGNVANVL
eukprot:COSAG05_NODE_12391_length_470_cov_0.555256_1_plen_62_part_01